MKSKEKCKGVKKSKIWKKDGKKILGMDFSREELERIYNKDNTIRSLVKNSIYHYEMLLALQQQILCLEAKIKILEMRR
jgi:hypothetical protein